MTGSQQRPSHSSPSGTRVSNSLVENTIAGSVSGVFSFLVTSALTQLFPDIGRATIIILVVLFVAAAVYLLRTFIIRTLHVTIPLIAGILIGILLSQVIQTSSNSPTLLATATNQPVATAPTTVIEPTQPFIVEVAEAPSQTSTATIIPTSTEAVSTSIPEAAHLTATAGTSSLIRSDIRETLIARSIPVELLEDALTGDCLAPDWETAGSRCWTTVRGNPGSSPLFQSMLLNQAEPMVITIYLAVSMQQYFNSATIAVFPAGGRGIWIEPYSPESEGGTVQRFFLSNSNWSIPEDCTHLGILRKDRETVAYLMIVPPLS